MQEPNDASGNPWGPAGEPQQHPEQPQQSSTGPSTQASWSQDDYNNSFWGAMQGMLDSQRNLTQQIGTLATMMAHQLTNPTPPVNVPLPVPPPVPPVVQPIVQPVTVSSSTGSLKGKEPEVFKGKADDVLRFVDAVTDSIMLQGHAKFDTDRKMVIWASSYLDGNTASWFSGVRRNADTAWLLDDFQSFFRAFKKHFQASDLPAECWDKVQKLYQTGSCSAYTTRFDELIAHCDITEFSKCNQYYLNLKDSVKDTLSGGKEPMPNVYDDLSAMAIRVDNQQHTRQREKSRTTASTSSSRVTHASAPIPTAPRVIYAPPPGPPPAAGVVPMEVDAVRTKRLTDSERLAQRQLRFASGACLYCGDTTHKLANCPTCPNKRGARVNAVEVGVAGSSTTTSESSAESSGEASPRE